MITDAHTPVATTRPLLRTPNPAWNLSGLPARTTGGDAGTDSLRDQSEDEAPHRVGTAAQSQSSRERGPLTAASRSPGPQRRARAGSLP